MVLAEWTIAIERRDSGQRIEWRGMSVAEIRDGLIVTWREYWNPLAVMPVIVILQRAHVFIDAPARMRDARQDTT